MRQQFLFPLVLLMMFVLQPEAQAQMKLKLNKGKKVMGYYIDNYDKKVKGKLFIGTITDNEWKVNFVTSSGEKLVLKPEEVKMYAYEESYRTEEGKKAKKWVEYHRTTVDIPPLVFGPTVVWMQKEVEGEIELFTYYTEVPDNPKNPYSYNYYIRIKGGAIKKVNEQGFSPIAKTIFNGYDALVDRIGKKDFKYKNLDRMVRDYNFWRVNKHDKKTYIVAMH